MLERRRKVRQRLLDSEILGNSIRIGKAALENLTDCLYFNAFISRAVICDIRLARDMSN